MFSVATQRSLSWTLALLMPVTLTTVSGLSGCYDRYDVVPTELVKLSDTQSATVSGVTGSTYVSTGKHGGYVSPTYGSSVVMGQRKLVRADGGVALVSGDSDVEVSAGGRKVRFPSPVMAEIQGNNLVVRGDNGAQTFPLSGIQRATVVQYDGVKTLLLSTGIGLGVLLVAGLITYAGMSASN